MHHIVLPHRLQWRNAYASGLHLRRGLKHLLHTVQLKLLRGSLSLRKELGCILISTRDDDWLAWTHDIVRIERSHVILLLMSLPCLVDEGLDAHIRNDVSLRGPLPPLGWLSTM